MLYVSALTVYRVVLLLLLLLLPFTVLLQKHTNLSPQENRFLLLFIFFPFFSLCDGQCCVLVEKLNGFSNDQGRMTHTGDCRETPTITTETNLHCLLHSLSFSFRNSLSLSPLPLYLSFPLSLWLSLLLSFSPFTSHCHTKSFVRSFFSFLRQYRNKKATPTKATCKQLYNSHSCQGVARHSELG